MPQLNPEFFLSQVFWLVITFSFLLFFLWKVSLPRISAVLKKREKQINDYMQIAEKLQTEAEEAQNKINQQLIEVREQTSELIKKTTKKLQNNMLFKLQEIDNDIKKNIDDSTKIIEENKKNALKNINIQIQEIIKLTILKLSDIHIDDKEIVDSAQKIQNNILN